MRKKALPRLLIFLAAILVGTWWFMSKTAPVSPEEAQTIADSLHVYANYTKAEYRIPMRDGATLHTVVYTPVDTSITYPILLKRTPYGCHPYGEALKKYPLGPSRMIMEDRYIFVYQDVRGRFLSDGEFENMRPMAHSWDSTAVDESTDTYDSIEWLLANLSNHNEKVGMYGISYPGFYAAAATVDPHPNLLAVSPQAPIADWYFDDFHHHGAHFMVHGFWFLYKFGQPRPFQTTKWPPAFEFPTEDAYQFFQDSVQTAKGINDRYYQETVAFWNEYTEHPNYDTFWKAHNLVPHLDETAPATLVVGGWFDAEDLYGPLSIYDKLKAEDDNDEINLVMGPWDHGGWARHNGNSLGDIGFGANGSPSEHYQEQIEFPFFTWHLKGERYAPIAPVNAFNTGTQQWQMYRQWPPEATQEKRLVLSAERKVKFGGDSIDLSTPPEAVSFVSDPHNPVPYTQHEGTRMIKQYMTEDQRFVANRDDVLVFETDTLTENFTVAGDFTAHLKVSTTGTAADWVVKVIDVYPDDHNGYPHNEDSIPMGGYQQMVRSEVIRGRYRNSYEFPEPFSPDSVVTINLPLQDFYHTFKPGHKLMIQIQSTWFPLVDINPQQYIENLYFCTKEDFRKETHTVWVGSAGTSFTATVLPE